ncbi:unnamed protein product (macronuclear) [Paramecium tetraurelia]|uniref:Uncharacterized protein n=1 Tax=Paramecium tetraurelia TaxID=5888 RepID=A0BSA6_PARTE|nr:uncharacterized protein GSPATT00031654001 [Paramecium tetraurelia]CAK61423.1 unnamed protein product [Paramecium tetraurelia]|eukprot:XP_001428821.1 hypothetical protein (macronuclear) [Paramecium tetraurelia strain d4-2]
MATTSYFSISFTENERGIIRNILQLPIQQYRYLENEVDALIETWRMCEKHQLPYQFYDNKQFYCPECLTSVRPIEYHYIRSIKDVPIEENQISSIRRLNDELAHYQTSAIPEINFEDRQKKLKSKYRSQSSNSQVLQNDRQSELSQLLEKRSKYLEVQNFISHISIEQKNRKIHDEMHNVDSQMKPRLQLQKILPLNQMQNNENSSFESILQEYFRRQI